MSAQRRASLALPLLSALTLLWCASFGPSARLATDWPAVWRDLDRLRELAPQSEPARTLAQELETLSAECERAARKVSDRVETFRARVVHAQVARLTSGSFQALRDPSIAMPWLPGEARRSFEVLGPCKTRPDAWLAALRESPAAERTSWLKLGEGLVEEEFGALRLDGAAAVAKALLASADDAPHAVLFARVCVQRERWEDALGALAHGNEVAQSDAEREALAWSRAELELARGDRFEAQRWLGAGLALGSARCALALALAAEAEGANMRARTLLRPWLEEPGLRHGAWRSYALALLPTSASH